MTETTARGMFIGSTPMGSASGAEHEPYVCPWCDPTTTVNYRDCDCGVVSS